MAKGHAHWALVGLLLLLASGAGIGYLLLHPATPDFPEERVIYVYPDQPFAAVVDSLHRAGILREARTFRWIALITGWDRQIKPGRYVLRSSLTHLELLGLLRKGLQTPLDVTIPPGMTQDRLAALLGAQLAFRPEDFLRALRDSAFCASLGLDTTRIFGYLFPETYNVYWTTSPEALIRRCVAQFRSFFVDSLRRRADALGLREEEVLTLASIIEWEAQVEREQPRIAGVYWNRLRRGWPLQADPTVQYALNKRHQRLSVRDYRVIHPYNTYLYPGLPPGPITNPSPSSILAALYPEEHRYFFFVSNGDGTHTFSRTYAEHLQAVRRYRAQRAESRSADR
ncbi:MAG: endolytic transglycosylase MltG [Bacteroidota bacterium]|nr:endolytic transglycosylase MltG [Rhodothermia bacterium]MCS7155593.1 endolytic transglycosylase MltG [Bacteroidota bacterium]MDW8137267.1 endolytic transglycosylase MltG [Bacteroidota bacterium]MDW8284863.1 endolytic transglycosylase MltG [Bacteroidota bacterium]